MDLLGYNVFVGSCKEFILEFLGIPVPVDEKELPRREYMPVEEVGQVDVYKYNYELLYQHHSKEFGIEYL